MPRLDTVFPAQALVARQIPGMVRGLVERVHVAGTRQFTRQLFAGSERVQAFAIASDIRFQILLCMTHLYQYTMSHFKLTPVLHRYYLKKIITL